jgi:cardiolipin synthase A/B
MNGSARIGPAKVGPASAGPYAAGVGHSVQLAQPRHYWRSALGGYRVRSHPRRWGRHIPRKWVRRLEPHLRQRRRKGHLSLWTRTRRLILAWWPWSIACLWALVSDRWWWALATGFVGLVNYLMTPEEFSPVYGLDHEFEVESDEFLQTVSGATGMMFVDGNHIALLNNGDEFYPAMLKAIDQAEASVTIEAYIYWTGEIGRRFAKALARRAKEGVSVKILLDAVGSASIGSEILETLESGGCQLAWYNRIHWYRIGRFNHRTHRKSLIVDGRLGFTGGAGIADVWLGHAQNPEHWRDMQIQLEGPAVVPLQTGFAANWLQTTGELITGERYYPPVDPCGRLPALTVMSSPETGASTVRTMYYLSIVCARKSIYIANPYFVPDSIAIETLIDAKQRGVDVRVMVSGAHNDNWLARCNSMLLFGPLLAAGVEILDYNRTMLHHKTMVVDGVWSTIGTTNFDNRSFAHNEESNVCVYDRALARQLQDTFLADAGDCERLTYEGWRKRGIWMRAQEVVASFLQDQV